MRTLFTFLILGLIPLLSYGQIAIDFEKQPLPPVVRGTTTKAQQVKILLTTKLSTDQSITVKKFDGDDKAGLFEPIVTHTFTANGRTDFPLIIEIIGDTTITDTRVYHFMLEYSYKSSGVNKNESKILTLEVSPYKKPDPDAVNEFSENDFLTFAGANIDPISNGAKLTNFSFEGVFKFRAFSWLNMRLGGYSNRNFSSDSASLPQIRYVRTSNKATIVDTSKIAVQQYRIDRQSTTRSYGFYTDLMFPLSNSVNPVRAYLFSHLEYVRRTVVTELNLGLSRLDTITYSSALAAQNIVTTSSPLSKEGLISPTHIIDQYYVTFGVLLECNFSKKFDLFFQPMYGYVERRDRMSTRPGGYFLTTYGSLSARIQANIRLIGITLAADLRDLTTTSPFFNISIGIPLSVSDILKRVKSE